MVDLKSRYSLPTASLNGERVFVNPCLATLHNTRTHNTKSLPSLHLHQLEILDPVQKVLHHSVNSARFPHPYLCPRPSIQAIRPPSLYRVKGCCKGQKIDQLSHTRTCHQQEDSLRAVWEALSPITCALCGHRDIGTSHPQLICRFSHLQQLVYRGTVCQMGLHILVFLNAGLRSINGQNPEKSAQNTERKDGL